MNPPPIVRPSSPNLHVTIGTLVLNNPILVAAGTFGYGVEFATSVRLGHLGALVTKTLTRQPRRGHPPPRLIETPSGLLNAVGLANIGLEAFLQEKLPALRAYPVPVIVSVLGESVEEVSAMVKRLDGADGVAAIELNLSCPNLNTPHPAKPPPQAEAPAVSSHTAQPLMVAQDPQATFEVVRAACQTTRKPVIAKLSPEVADLAPIAQAAERAGSSAVSLVNTFMGMSIDPQTRRSRLGAMTGGLSGPAIRPLAVYRVWYTAQIVKIPVIGMGGIVRASDALEFFLAGASAVAVGTASFAHPACALHVLKGLTRYLARHRIGSLEELRGAVNR